jgi:hypothetical protein
MAKHSLRHRLRKKHEKTALSPRMRDLIMSSEAQYGQRKSQDVSRSTQQESGRH